MERNTPLAEDIETTDQSAKYDAACKRLLSHKQILARILKSCLAEFRDCDVKEIAEKYIEGTPQVDAVSVNPDETNASKVRGIGNEDTSLTEGTVTYDIRFAAVVPRSGERIRLIINVEAQNQFKLGYPLIKRAIYYCGRMISAQKGTEFEHSEYQKIKKVYSIWICMDPPPDRRNTITRYHVTEENLVGCGKEPLENYDLLCVVMVCLGGADSENYDGILRMLDVLLSTEVGAAEKKRVLQDDYGMLMTEALETEVQTMCNLSQGVEEKGRLKGFAEGEVKGRVKGREEGRVEGRAEGREEGVLLSIRSLMTNTGWPAEKAMEILGVPEAERSKYADLLLKQ